MHQKACSIYLYLRCRLRRLFRSREFTDLYACRIDISARRALDPDGERKGIIGICGRLTNNILCDDQVARVRTVRESGAVCIVGYLCRELSFPFVCNFNSYSLHVRIKRDARCVQRTGVSLPVLYDRVDMSSCGSVDDWVEQNRTICSCDRLNNVIAFLECKLKGHILGCRCSVHRLGCVDRGGRTLRHILIDERRNGVRKWADAAGAVALVYKDPSVRKHLGYAIDRAGRKAVQLDLRIPGDLELIYALADVCEGSAVFPNSVQIDNVSNCVGIGRDRGTQLITRPSAIFCSVPGSHNLVEASWIGRR